MKRFHFAAGLLFLVLGAVPCLVHANDESDARQAIQCRYDKFDSAYMKKEFTGVAEVFSPECTMRLVGEGRTLKALSVIKGMKSVSRSLTVSHARTRILSLKPAGSHFEVAAVWTADSVYSPTNHSKEDPPRRSRAKQMFQDTWAKTGSGWQITGRIIEESEDDTKSKSKK